MNTLKSLYEQHKGKVSDKWEFYLHRYENALTPYRNKAISLLEIGVQNGGSLEIWAKYFPKAERFVGCDINPDCSSLQYTDNRITLLVGDANSDTIETSVLENSNAFDIIIDDGSHTSADIIKSFFRYFPHLRNDGLFIAEDIHCSYWQEYGGGLYHPYSAMEFFKKLSDVINHQHWGIEKDFSSFLYHFEQQFGSEIKNELLETIYSIEFSNSLCIITKKEKSRTKLGKRVIAGSSAKVDPKIAHFSNLETSTPDQLTNPWARLTASPAELWDSETTENKKRGELIIDLGSKIDTLESTIELLKTEKSGLLENLSEEKEITRKLSEDNTTLKEENIALEEENLTLNETKKHLVESTSWKITLPIRLISTSLKKVSGLAKTLRRILINNGIIGTFKKANTLISNKGFAATLTRLTPAETADKPTEPSEYQTWYETRYSEEWELEISSKASKLDRKPLISIIMPVYQPELDHFSQAVASVQDQLYPNWELCIIDDASEDLALTEILNQLKDKDSRIKVSINKTNQHISLTSNRGLEMCTGDYITLLDHDDLLPKHALAVLAVEIASAPEVEFFYSDEDHILKSGLFSEPFFKPSWSPHLLYSQNYLTHLSCFSKELLDRCSPFRQGFEGAQDYDLFLRLTHEANKVSHIPEILYHWREHEGSTALNSSSKPYAHKAGENAVSGFLSSKYKNQFSGLRESDATFTYSPIFTIPDSILVSIIIPTRDKVDLLKPCIDSILEISTWKNFEIIIVDNQSSESETLNYFDDIRDTPNISIVPADIPFNWSKVNNIGASHAKGNVYIFLNNDIEIISPDWIEKQVSYALLPEVACVGPLLLYDNGLIQHAGVVVGMNGWADHIFKATAPEHRVGPFVSPTITRNVLAVTGACTTIEAEKFELLGRYDEGFVICGSDIELSIRAFKNGYFNIYAPEARLCHYESMSRDNFVPEVDFIQSDLKYAPYRVEKTDPFFNPHLAKDRTTPTL